MFEIEVGEVLAVEQVGRKLLQAAAGQIYRVDSLGHHLDGGGEESEKSGEVTERKRNVELNRIISTTRHHKTFLVYCV